MSRATTRPPDILAARSRARHCRRHRRSSRYRRQQRANVAAAALPACRNTPSSVMPRSVEITAPHTLTRMRAPSAKARPQHQRVEQIAFKSYIGGDRAIVERAREGRNEIHLARRPTFDEAAAWNLDYYIYLRPRGQRVTINGPIVACVFHLASLPRSDRLGMASILAIKCGKSCCCPVRGRFGDRGATTGSSLSSRAPRVSLDTSHSAATNPVQRFAGTSGYRASSSQHEIGRSARVDGLGKEALRRYW
jgi:hypothetical protein